MASGPGACHGSERRQGADPVSDLLCLPDTSVQHVSALRPVRATAEPLDALAAQFVVPADERDPEHKVAGQGFVLGGRRHLVVGCPGSLGIVETEGAEDTLPAKLAQVGVAAGGEDGVESHITPGVGTRQQMPREHCFELLPYELLLGNISLPSSLNG